MPTLKEIKRDGLNVIGVVTSLDAVESYCYSDRADVSASHSDIWPQHLHCRWRWDPDVGLHFFDETAPDEFQVALIRAHLHKKYSIKYREMRTKTLTAQ